MESVIHKAHKSLWYIIYLHSYYMKDSLPLITKISLSQWKRPSVPTVASSSAFPSPLQPSMIYQMPYPLSVAPTADTFGPHLCFAVNNVMVLTPPVYVYVGESHWVPVIATPPRPTPFLFLSLPHLSAGQWCPMYRSWAVTAYPSCLTHWPARNRFTSTVYNWYTNTHIVHALDIFTCLHK